MIDIEITPIETLVGASNADGYFFCDCDYMCSAMFLAKAYDLTWEFVKSIQEFGIIDPINFDTVYSVVSNGNHRIVAAILLGYDRLPTSDYDESSDKGPSGWPETFCIHQSAKNRFVMGDPAFERAIIEFSKMFSTCGLPEICHHCGEPFDYDGELD